MKPAGGRVFSGENLAVGCAESLIVDEDINGEQRTLLCILHPSQDMRRAVGGCGGTGGVKGK